jgi:hypothetical protein
MAEPRGRQASESLTSLNGPVERVPEGGIVSQSVTASPTTRQTTARKPAFFDSHEPSQTVGTGLFWTLAAIVCRLRTSCRKKQYASSSLAFRQSLIGNFQLRSAHGRVGTMVRGRGPRLRKSKRCNFCRIILPADGTIAARSPCGISACPPGSSSQHGSTIAGTLERWDYSLIGRRGSPSPRQCFAP